MIFILRPGESGPLSNLLTMIASRDAEKAYKVEFKEYRKSRSLEQNAYYWGVVLPTIQKFIMEHRGDEYSSDEIHEWYRNHYLPKRPVTIKGDTVIARPSTASLTTQEFSEYLELVIHHAAENGIVIPPPEYRGET